MQKAGGSILLVDDDEAVLDVFARILQKEGFPVTAVKSIEAAKQSVEESEYAVVLYDLSVGGMRNALELASVLQDEYPTMKVLMITGMVSPDVAAEVTRRGLEILEKPLGVKTLVRVISCHVKKRIHSAA
ncbi:MAG TPA: response regulator [Terriglobales bacterium]|nr:response regulator [Terriglobales bacterium]